MSYRGSSLIRNCHFLRPYRRLIPRALRWSWGGGSLLSARYPCSERPVQIITTRVQPYPSYGLLVDTGLRTNLIIFLAAYLSTVNSAQRTVPACSTRSREIGILIVEQPAPAPHLAHPEGRAALRIVLITVPRVSRSCARFIILEPPLINLEHTTVCAFIDTPSPSNSYPPLQRLRSVALHYPTPAPLYIPLLSEYGT